ncbi:AAA family ATPase [Pendulispora brunnea]|uniref:DNA 5'-3' helicase n=1 Tax=Pendulispora brunnea TaxID=2905690 RepID=A0ABZ2KRL9_9BACT
MQASQHLRLVGARSTPEPVHDPESGRIPPHDLDAEVAVLSALLLDDQRIRQVSSFLLPEHFYAEAHRRIYEALTHVAKTDAPDGERACIVRVGSWLKDRGRIEQIGGMAYLTEILNYAPAIANVGQYAMIVHDKWRARQVIARCQEFAARGYVDYGDAQAFADGAVRALSDVARRNIAGKVESNLTALKRIVKEIAARMEAAGTRPVGILTGFAGYDHETGGLHACDKTTIAALPGVGKTAFALQIAVNVAMQGIGVLILSNEMGRDQLLLRILARLARVDGRRLRDGKLTQPEWDRVIEAAGKLAILPILIDDTEGMTVGYAMHRARMEVGRMLEEFEAPLGLIVLDWVQNFGRDAEMHGAKDHEVVKHSTRALKDLGKELRLPVLEVAQMKPAEIDRTTKVRPRPTKGCVADSSWVEKVSDGVVYLHRNPLREGERIVGEDPSSLTLCMTKNRWGDEGCLQLRFDRPLQAFECIDSKFGEAA